MDFDRTILQLILEKDSKSDFLIGRPWANSRRKFQPDRSRDKPDTLQVFHMSVCMSVVSKHEQKQ